MPMLSVIATLTIANFNPLINGVFSDNPKKFLKKKKSKHFLSGKQIKFYFHTSTDLFYHLRDKRWHLPMRNRK